MDVLDEYDMKGLYKDVSGIYGFYIPKPDRYLYIGKASDIKKRTFMSLHERFIQAEKRFNNFSSFLSYELHIWRFNQIEKDIFEPYLIHKHKPLLNTQFIVEEESCVNLDTYIHKPEIYTLTYSDVYQTWGKRKKIGHSFCFFKK